MLKRVISRCDSCCRFHPEGPCEEVNRGRRFFLLGALAAPVLAKLPPVPPSAIVYMDTDSFVTVNGVPWTWRDTQKLREGGLIHPAFPMTRFLASLEFVKHGPQSR